MLYDHLRGRRILVFAGHTNKFEEKQDTLVGDPGTVGLTCGGWSHYTTEAEVNLDIALDLARELRVHSREPGECTDKGCTVFIGHGSWQRRAKLAAVLNPDAVIDIHCNAYVDDQVRGYECWYGGDDLSKDLAERIVAAVGQGTLVPSRGVKDMYAEDNPRKRLFEEIFTRPCVLFEAGFLTNAEDCKLLTHDGAQSIIALKVGIGINSFFGRISETSEPGTGGGADSPDDD